jgi:hypothetical protein
VVADVRDPPRALLLDHRLVGSAPLQVVEPDELHVALLVRRGAERDCREQGQDDSSAHLQ